MKNNIHGFPVRVVTKSVVCSFNSASKWGYEQILEVYFVYMLTSVFALFYSLLCKLWIYVFVVAVHLKPTLQRKSQFSLLSFFQYLVRCFVGLWVRVSDQHYRTLTNSFFYRFITWRAVQTQRWWFVKRLKPIKLVRRLVMQWEGRRHQAPAIQFKYNL